MAPPHRFESGSTAWFQRLDKRQNFFRKFFKFLFFTLSEAGSFCKTHRQIPAKTALKKVRKSEPLF